MISNKSAVKKFIYLSAIAFCFAVACNPPKSDKAKTTEAKEEAKNPTGESYRVDAAASKIEWIGTKVSGYHTGTVNVKSGELMVTNGMVTAGNFVIDMTTIVATGPEQVSEANCKKLTGHLQSSDFFDVQKFPGATFAITGVKPSSGQMSEPDDPRQEKLKGYKVTNPTHTVSGNLTIKGITKNIEFPARLTISNNVLEATAKFNVNRKDWGVVYPGQPDDLIRDEIHLGIYLKANRNESLTDK